MVRAVFLKYALQLRLRRVSGAIVAYPNTSEILRLEYLPLKDVFWTGVRHTCIAIVC